MVGPGPQPPEADAASAALLRRAWQDDAWHFPGTQPAFDEAGASSTAVWFYSAAMCYADRSMTVELSTRLLEPPIFQRINASVHYSVDLVLRHLPALHELASGLAQSDPVLLSLKRMAWLWPLASMGVSLPLDWGLPDTSHLRSHPGLWRLYLDRIIASGDPAALHDDATRSEARLSLGLHPGLVLRLLPHWQAVEPPPLSLPSTLAS